MAPVLHMLAGEPGEDNPKLRKAVCRLTVYVADHCMERFLCRYYKGAYPEMDRMAGSPLRRKLTDEELAEEQYADMDEDESGPVMGM